jgi:uncharacterized SAM-binding protein YcdF (DUF218 family)
VRGDFLKALVNPYFLFLLLQLAGWVILRYRCWAVMSRAGKSIWFLCGASLLGIAALSTPLVSRGLEHCLSGSFKDQGEGAPAYIFVLGGGYLPGTTLDQDVLVVDSSRRVLAAVAWWRKYPQAKLVFSGAEKGIRDRPRDRLARLMAETAMGQGVPESHVILESDSTNTREHPLEALRLPGITAETRIGLVTSGWHMRRALREFRRVFSIVEIRSVPLSNILAGAQVFVPDPDILGASTVYLQEVVGYLWYALC